MIKGLCDTQAPPRREFSPRHVIACHLDEHTLLAMEPVITIDRVEHV
jgi:peptide/nickel transport system ATP-binding protein